LDEAELSSLKQQNLTLKSSRLWIGISFSIACLGLIFWQIDVKRIMIVLREANWQTVPVIIGSYMAFMILRAWRWQIMLGSEVRYWPVFHAQSIGYLLTNLLPFRVGDLGRAYLIGQQSGLSGFQTLSSVILERVLDMLVIVLLFFLSVTMVPTMPHVIAQAGKTFVLLSILSFCTILLFVSHQSRAMTFTQWVLKRISWVEKDAWLRRAELFFDGLRSLRQWRLLAVVLGLSFIIWMAGAAAFYWGIGAFWPEVTWSVAIFTLCAAIFGVSIPSSPSAIGVFHASVWLALSVFPVTGEQALGFAFVYHALTFIIVLILGSIGLWKSGQTLAKISITVKRLLAKRWPGSPKT
jgi:uncharacterized protein (TIRG00374 family)